MRRGPSPVNATAFRSPSRLWPGPWCLWASREKKSIRASEQDRPDVKARREEWKAEQPELESGKLVFHDKTWLSTNMTRTHGRGKQGQRLVMVVPHGHWKTTTFLIGLIWTGLVAPVVMDGPVNGDLFTAYLEQYLVSTLRPGDIVVMDNLSSHKRVGVQRALEAGG